MTKNALVVYGGFEGHRPEQCAAVFIPFLEKQGYRVHPRTTLEVYADKDFLASLDLILQIWTLGDFTAEQGKGLSDAVRSGVGLAGFHGGIVDSWRSNPKYQWMTGGQFVAHPGCGPDTKIPSHAVNIVDRDHPITRGLPDFELQDTEQYYMIVDPGVHVLATTTFSGEYGTPGLYPPGVVMPYAWTRTWGDGRVFVAGWGHTEKDFDEPTALAIVERGLLWATRTSG
ncbi:MAG: ThuA domain-containing protein [Phycisphaerae bacterium]|nr:ThuA domain-containing protein [Phycisphaerae bacterium]